MKTEKEHSEKDKKSGGFSTVATAFMTGAATGLTVGLFLSSEKGSKLKEKITGLIKEFTGGTNDRQED